MANGDDIEARIGDYVQITFDSIQEFKDWLEAPNGFPNDTALTPINGRAPSPPLARHQSLDSLLELLTPPSELIIRSDAVVQNRRVADAAESNATSVERTADATETAVVIAREREDREAGA